MARITARTDSFLIDYRKEALPALFQQQQSDADLSRIDAWLQTFSSNDLLRILEKTRLRLLLGTSQLKNDRIIQALRALAERGVRIYLVLGKEADNRTAIDTLSGRCLIRTGVEQQGALLLQDHATLSARGYMLLACDLLAAPDAPTGFVAQLEPSQCKDSYRSFCKLFWECAEREFIEQHKGAGTEPHPEGGVVVNHSHHLPDSMHNNLAEMLTSASLASLASTQAPPPQTEKHRLLLSGRRPAPHIAALLKPESLLSLTDNRIPNLLIGTQAGWLLPDQPDNARVNWCLRLSTAQTEHARRALALALEEAAWQFKFPAAVAELAEAQAIRFADQPDLIRRCERHREQRLQDFYSSSLDSFLNDKAQDLVRHQTGWQRDLLAHQIRYDVTIHPPYCPKSANRDALYQAWAETESQWQNHLERLEQQLHQAERLKQGLADAIRYYLKGFLLGQDQSRKAITRQLNELKEWRASEASPAERKARQEQLEALVLAIGKRLADTALEVDKAEQQQAWEQKRAALRAARDAQCDLKQRKARELAELEILVPQRVAALDAEFQTRWAAGIVQLNEKQREEIKLGQAELEAFDYQQAREWARNTCKEKILRKHYHVLSRPLEDRKAGADKVERDLAHAQSALAEAERRVTAAQKALDELGAGFIYQSGRGQDEFDRQLGNRAGEPHYAPIQWPSEDLPDHEFELKSDNGTRWLLLSDTDRLERARRDAARLNATLCVARPEKSV